MFLLAAHNSGNWSTTLDLLGRFFSVIIAIAFVMLLAYITTRWLAGARYRSRGKSNIRLMEGITVGHQSSVQLVKAGEKIFLIGVTREHITFLAEVPIDEIHEPETALPAAAFEKYLKAYRDKLTGKTDND